MSIKGGVQFKCKTPRKPYRHMLLIRFLAILFSTCVLHVIYSFTNMHILMFFLLRWYIKLFIVNGATNCYICDCSIYSGKDSSDVLKRQITLNHDCFKTTQTVLGLLDKIQLLDNGRHMYFANYNSSPEFQGKVL